MTYIEVILKVEFKKIGTFSIVTKLQIGQKLSTFFQPLTSFLWPFCPLNFFQQVWSRFFQEIQLIDHKNDATIFDDTNFYVAPDFEGKLNHARNFETKVASYYLSIFLTYRTHVLVCKRARTLEHKNRHNIQ